MGLEILKTLADPEADIEEPIHLLLSAASRVATVAAPAHA